MTRQPPSGDAPEMTCGICGQWASNGLHSGDGSGHDFAPSKVFRRRDPAPSGDALREALWTLGNFSERMTAEEMRVYARTALAEAGPDEQAQWGVALGEPLDVERLARALIESGLMRRYADYANSLPTMIHGSPEQLAPEWATAIARAYAEQEGGA